MCNDVCIEPELQPVTGEELTGATANSQAGARLDIAANGVWGVPSRERTSMLEYSTLMLHQTGTPICNQSTESMNRLRSVHMNNGFERLNTLPSRALRYWWSSQRGQHFLQETGLHARLQVEPHLQQHSMLATLPSIVLPPPILHSGYQRCQIIMWSCHQNAHGGRPSQLGIPSINISLTLLL